MYLQTLILPRLINQKYTKVKRVNTIQLLNDEPGQYGDSGYIMTEQTKDERDAKVQKEYLGNVKVVWTNGQNVTTAEKQGVQQSIEAQSVKQEEPDLPF